jgi:hypothetical protein
VLSQFPTALVAKQTDQRAVGEFMALDRSAQVRDAAAFA